MSTVAPLKGDAGRFSFGLGSASTPAAATPSSPAGVVTVSQPASTVGYVAHFGLLGTFGEGGGRSRESWYVMAKPHEVRGSVTIFYLNHVIWYLRVFVG